MNFSNTEIAFRHLSDNSLKRAYLLFVSMSQNLIVDLGSKALLLAMKLKLPVTALVKATMFDHFCGGESIEECQKLATRLAKFNIGTIGDYSVEGNLKEESFDFACEEIARTIKFASNNMTPAFAVFKMTGMGNENLLQKIQDGNPLTSVEKEAFVRIKGRVKRLCQLAKDKKVRIMVDAEDFAFQGTIDQITEELMTEFNQASAVVYQTIQMYRIDRLKYLKRLHKTAVDKNFMIGIKAVRGAYLEKERSRAAEYGYPDPIQKTKEDTDKDFNECLNFCIKNIERIWLFSGTHNEKSTFLLTELMDKANMVHDDPRVVFSQLYGMSDNLSYNLAHHGYTVRKYVPYGPIREVLPYLIRRAEENTSIKGQTGRELALLKEEMARRKNNTSS